MISSIWCYHSRGFEYCTDLYCCCCCWWWLACGVAAVELMLHYFRV